MERKVHGGASWGRPDGAWSAAIYIVKKRRSRCEEGSSQLDHDHKHTRDGSVMFPAAIVHDEKCSNVQIREKFTAKPEMHQL